MKVILSTVLLLTFLSTNLYSQKLLGAYYENAVYLVDKATSENLVIRAEDKSIELPMAIAKVFLKDIPAFLPGYIAIEDEGGIATDTDSQNRSVSNSVFYRYHAKVTSNRDLMDPYIVFHWSRENDSQFVAAIPIKSLEADIEQLISMEFYVPDKFKLVDPDIHFMSMGFEIGTSKTIEKPVTPYEFSLQEAEDGKLADGNIKPVRLIPVTPIKDDEGNVRNGSAHIVVSIDEKGYVSNTRVQKCSEWIFAKAALMDAPFFLFCPKIVEGKPVATKVVIPFKF